MIAAASGPAGGWVAATDGTPSVSVWHLPGSGRGPSPAIVLAHSEPAEAVAVTATAETVITAVVGGTQASLWALPAAGGQPGGPVTWEVEPGLDSHLAVARLSHAAVVAAAGPEGIRLWLAARNQPPVPWPVSTSRSSRWRSWPRTATRSRSWPPTRTTACT